MRESFWQEWQGKIYSKVAASPDNCLEVSYAYGDSQKEVLELTKSRIKVLHDGNRLVTRVIIVHIKEQRTSYSFKEFEEVK